MSGCSVNFRSLGRLLDDIALRRITRGARIPTRIVARLTVICKSHPISAFFNLNVRHCRGNKGAVQLVSTLVTIDKGVNVPNKNTGCTGERIKRDFSKTTLALPRQGATFERFAVVQRTRKVLATGSPRVGVVFIAYKGPLARIPSSSEMHRTFTSIRAIIIVSRFVASATGVTSCILPITAIFRRRSICCSSVCRRFIGRNPGLIRPPKRTGASL